MLAFKRGSGQDPVNPKGLVSFVFRSCSPSRLAKCSFREFRPSLAIHIDLLVPSFHSLGECQISVHSPEAGLWISLLWGEGGGGRWLGAISS